MEKKNIVEELCQEYVADSEVVMGEFLAWKKVPEGMTFEQAFEAYIGCMKAANDDRFFVIKEGETIEL